jgi:SseB protein N-terminal domain
MTELDTLLERCIKEEEEQGVYYDLVLNSKFYIPILEDDVAQRSDEDNVTPVVLEADDKPYMMLFDTEERLRSWADENIKFIVLPGNALVELSTPELYWALNIGTDFQKEFVPEEISWLKDVVKQCQLKAAFEGKADL